MYIKIRVRAGMREEVFTQKSVDHFEIDVKEKAERNMANRKVLELIERYFKLKQGSVRIVNGHHSPNKILSVPDVLIK